MKRNLITIILVMAIIGFSKNGIANSSDLNFFSKKPDKTFVVSSKSRTIEMKKGQTYRMKMKLRKNRHYFMSVKGKKKLGCIQYRIIDPNKNNEVIFDNSAYEFDKNMTFHNDVDRNVIIEIRTMPCCYENSFSKKSNVKLLFANKKLKKNEEFYFNNSYNLYAVN